MKHINVNGLKQNSGLYELHDINCAMNSSKFWNSVGVSHLWYITFEKLDWNRPKSVWGTVPPIKNLRLVELDRNIGMLSMIIFTLFTECDVGKCKVTLGCLDLFLDFSPAFPLLLPCSWISCQSWSVASSCPGVACSALTAVWLEKLFSFF